MIMRRAYETLVDEDKRRQYDNENMGGRKKYGFEKDPFD